jgi:hypothetical protein
MKLKTFTQEEFINFIKYVKMNVSFADNVIITLCKEIKNVILYINIISSDMQNNINLQLNNKCKITIVNGTIPQDKIELIEKYIFNNLYVDDKYEIEI